MIKGSLLVLAVAFSFIILLAGCTGTQPNNQQTPSTQPAQPAAPAASQSSNGCPSPYDGTYRGTMSDSGTMMVQRPPGSAWTESPFTVSYDFEMTLQCDQFISNGNAWAYRITHVVASHPMFDCASGCTPATNSEADIGESGSGAFLVTFPNGATTFTDESPAGLQMSQDGKTMTIPFTGGPNGEVIIARDASLNPIEIYDCQQGGQGTCGVETTNSNTMTLTKVS